VDAELDREIHAAPAPAPVPAPVTQGAG